jgi:hypothetical protein
MAKVKVCVSYDHEHDQAYRRLLEAWDANPSIPFSFNSLTPEEIKSDDYGVVKRVLSLKINDATRLLVIVGKHVTKRHPRWQEIGDHNWIYWEINKAKSLGKKLVAVKLDRTFETPEPLLNSGAAWAFFRARGHYTSPKGVGAVAVGG